MKDKLVKTGTLNLKKIFYCAVTVKQFMTVIVIKSSRLFNVFISDV